MLWKVAPPHLFYLVLKISLASLVSLTTSWTYSQKVKWKMSWQVIFNVSVARLIFPWLTAPEVLCDCACMLSCSVVSNSLWPLGLQPARLLCLWDFSGKNTGVGCHIFPRGIFPNQRLNLDLLCLLHCRQVVYALSHRESPLWLCYYQKQLQVKQGGREDGEGSG